MLSKFTDALFWEYRYDEQYRSMTYGLHFPLSDQIGEEKRLYWRTIGKRRGLNPEMAAYTAFEAGVLAMTEKRESSAYRDLIIDLVEKLALSIPRDHPNYEKKFTDEFVLNERLRPYFEEGQQRRNATQIRISEVDSFQLSEKEFEQTVKMLRTGKIPSNVIKIYESIDVGRTAHDVCSRTGMNFYTVLFWLDILVRMNVITRRQHMNMEAIFWRQRFLVENKTGEPYETFRRLLSRNDL